MITMADTATRAEPRAVSPFIGRRHELAQIKRLLRKTRLLTLTGTGGVGKSRLAARAAHDLRVTYGGAVAIADLATLEDADLLEPTIAAALGLCDTDRPALSALLDHLAGNRTLLVLDNCEHLGPRCAAVADRLLRGAPRLRLLATSRHRLGVYGERLLYVPSLGVADPGLSPREIARSDAVRLFTDRAATVHPGFTIHPGNARTIARITGRLDGIPLALELAAVRLRTTTLDQLLHELDDRLSPTTGDTTALPRHQTLRATMDWSRDLCSSAEQRLWARLSLFPAGTDLTTTEEVCAGPDLAPDQIFDLISALVDKSILTAEIHGTTTRYRMLDSIRAYGREHLTTDEDGDLRGRLCAYYHRVARECRVDRLVPDQVGRYWRLQRERPNVRVALESCLTRPDSGSAGLEIAATLWPYWLITGALTEGRHWLERGLGTVRERTPARAMALWAGALLAIYQGDVRVANEHLEEAMALAAEIEDESALAFALQISGVAAVTAGDPDAGFALLDEARERHRAIGDVHALGLNLYLATLYYATTAPEVADRLGTELLELCEARGAALYHSYAQFAIGVAACNQGEWQRAEDLMRQVAIPWSVLHDRWGLAQVLEVLAWTAGARGDHHRAARLLGAADATWREIDTSPIRVQYSRRSHRRCEEAARRTLGDRAFGAAFRNGARLGLDVAVAYALRGDSAEAGHAPPDLRAL